MFSKILAWIILSMIILTKPTKWPVRPAKTQISLGIRPVWSESSLSSWRNIGPLTTYWAYSDDSDQTGQMPRLIWVFAVHTCHIAGFVFWCLTACFFPFFIIISVCWSVFTWKYLALMIGQNPIYAKETHQASLLHTEFVGPIYRWAPSSEFVSLSIPSWKILTAHAQPFRGARDLAFCLNVPLDSLLVWANSEGSGQTARMRRLAWTFAAHIGDKYQIRLTLSRLC